MIPLSRWENGSFFHWFPDQPVDQAPSPWDEGGRLYGSGRDALRAVIQMGMSQRGWERLWVPSYYCLGVVESFVDTGIEVKLYPDRPEDALPPMELIDTRPGDAVIRMNYFGLRGKPWQDGAVGTGVEIVEDHTHDPWSQWARQSAADWCIASLRKTLPTPDGGVLWSPRGHQMPPEPPVTQEHETACLRRLGAMVMKDLYLRGHPVSKDVFRRLATVGEEHIACGPVSAMPEWSAEMLAHFPVKTWRNARRRNWQALARMLGGVPGIRMLEPMDRDACPFAGIVVCETEELRDSIRDQLVDRQVYATILWPMDNPPVPGVPEQHVDFSRRMLTIHCDMRYTEADMKTVADYIRELAGRAMAGRLEEAISV